jgi:hypothetical protein
VAPVAGLADRGVEGASAGRPLRSRTRRDQVVLMAEPCDVCGEVHGPDNPIRPDDYQAGCSERTPRRAPHTTLKSCRLRSSRTPSTRPSWSASRRRRRGVGASTKAGADTVLTKGEQGFVEALEAEPLPRGRPRRAEAPQRPIWPVPRPVGGLRRVGGKFLVLWPHFRWPGRRSSCGPGELS